MSADNMTPLLLQQLQQLDTLTEKLEQELHSISARDADALMQLVEEKSTLLDAIAATDSALSEVMHKGIVLDAEQQQLVAAIETQLEGCKYRTAINQKAVEQGQLRLTHLQHLLNELRAKESLTYDRKGKTSAVRSSRDISA